MKPKVDGVRQEEETTERRPNRLGARHREPTLLCSTPALQAAKSCIHASKPHGEAQWLLLSPPPSPTQMAHPAMSHLTSIRGSGATEPLGHRNTVQRKTAEEGREERKGNKGNQ